MGTNKDEWIADVSSFVRNSFGNAGFVTPADVSRVRAAAGPQDDVDRRGTGSSLPRALVPDARWKVTASHDAQPARRKPTPPGASTSSATRRAR